MSENSAKKRIPFQNEESLQSIKQGLDISTVNNFLINDPDKALAYINYWANKKGSLEQKRVYAIEVAKAEALMQRMMDLSIDVYGVNAIAYVDAQGEVASDTSVEEVLVDVAKKGKDMEYQKLATTKVEEVPIISIFNGEVELKTPKLTDLSVVVKSLIRKGHFDNAMLLASKFLTTGDYIPKKEKQNPVKWSEDKIASWIKDINEALMSEKHDAKKETIKNNTDAAGIGLTSTEVEGLRLLEMIIPDAIAGHQDFTSRREKLNRYMTLGESLDKEQEMLWAVASRIGGANSTAKIPEADLARLYSDIEKFCKLFFAHRPYTEKSVKVWRDAAKKEVGIANFTYLVVKEDMDVTKMKKSGISFEALDIRIKEETLAGKTVEDILLGLEEGILYKEITGADSSYFVYTKLHAKDLIERIHSKYYTNPDKSDPDLKSVSITKADKIDQSEIKLLIATLVEHGGIIDDVKSHPEIIGLIGKEIQIDTNVPTLKFGNESTLFPWIETIFAEVSAKVGTVVVADERVEKEYADLSNLTTLCEFAAKNDVNQEDFIKEHKDLVIDADGKYKSLMSENSSGGSRTISIANEKDFTTWVATIYQAITKEIPSDPELVASLKELQSKGKELLDKGTTYEIFINWLNKNLLNRKLLEQKPDKMFKSIEAIKSFAQNTFGKKLPKPATKVVESNVEKEKTEPVIGESKAEVILMTMDEINAKVAEASKEEGTTLYNLVRMLHSMYTQNKIQIDGQPCGLKMCSDLTEAVVKESNPQMYVERQERKAILEANKKDQLVLPLVEDAEIVDQVENVETIVEELIKENQVFEKIDVAAMDPELWKAIEKFTEINEVYNQAVEFNEVGNFNAALSMCLVILPKIEASKEWTPEYITDWVNKMILHYNDEKSSEVVETSSKVEEPVIVVPEGFEAIGDSVSKKGMRHAITDILKAKEDNKELRQSIINAIKAGKGAHARQVSKMPVEEMHKMINNMKDKVGKFSEVTE